MHSSIDGPNPAHRAHAHAQQEEQEPPRVEAAHRPPNDRPQRWRRRPFNLPPSRASLTRHDAAPGGPGGAHGRRLRPAAAAIVDAVVGVVSTSSSAGTMIACPWLFEHLTATDTAAPPFAVSLAYLRRRRRGGGGRGRAPPGRRGRRRRAVGRRRRRTRWPSGRWGMRRMRYDRSVGRLTVWWVWSLVAIS